MDNRYTFKKKERLFIQKEIDFLFEKGVSFIVYPLRVIYVEKQPVSGAEAAILISVPRKKFKRAVKRNRVKRLIREAYRLNKEGFLQGLREKKKGLLIGFLFVGNELPEWGTVEGTVIKTLSFLSESLGL